MDRDKSITLYNTLFNLAIIPQSIAHEKFEKKPLFPRRTLSLSFIISIRCNLLKWGISRPIESNNNTDWFFFLSRPCRQGNPDEMYKTIFVFQEWNSCVDNPSRRLNVQKTPLNVSTSIILLETSVQNFEFLDPARVELCTESIK